MQSHSKTSSTTKRTRENNHSHDELLSLPRALISAPTFQDVQIPLLQAQVNALQAQVNALTTMLQKAHQLVIEKDALIKEQKRYITSLEQKILQSNNQYQNTAHLRFYNTTESDVRRATKYQENKQEKYKATCDAKRKRQKQ